MCPPPLLPTTRLLPAARWRPGLTPSSAATPEGMAERRQAHIPCSRAALVRRGAHLAIGALASRRSAVTVLGPRSPRAAAPALPPEPPRGPRQPGSSSPDQRPLNLPDRTSPGRHARSVCRIVSGDAPHRAGCATHTPTPICSQQLSTVCRKHSRRVCPRSGCGYCFFRDLARRARNLSLEPELVAGQAVGGGHHGIRQRMCAPRSGVRPVGRTRTGCRTPRAIA
jgi:hypothetical protein